MLPALDQAHGIMPSCRVCKAGRTSSPKMLNPRCSPAQQNQIRHQQQLNRVERITTIAANRWKLRATWPDEAQRVLSRAEGNSNVQLVDLTGGSGAQ